MTKLICIQHTGSDLYLSWTKCAKAKLRFGRGALRQVMASGLEQWIEDNCNYQVAKHAGDFWFMDLSDAMAFKIVWGGR